MNTTHNDLGLNMLELLFVALGCFVHFVTVDRRTCLITHFHSCIGQRAGIIKNIELVYRKARASLVEPGSLMIPISFIC